MDNNQIPNIEDMLNSGMESVEVRPAPSATQNALPDFVKQTLNPLDNPLIQRFRQSIQDVKKYCAERGEMGGMDWGFESMNKAFEGLNAGVHLIGGQSNIGKSAVCMQLAWQIAQANRVPTPMRPRKAFVLYFSLDDAITELLPRFVAIDQRIPINAVRFPAKHKDDLRLMEAAEQGWKNIDDNALNIAMMDVNAGSSVEFIEETIDQYVNALAMIDPAYQIVVVIDNFHDVTVDAKGYTEGNVKYDHIADKLSRICAKYDCPMLCTAEFRKLNGNRRPVLDDIKESGKIVYEAKAVLLSYNEVSYRNQQANVFWTDGDTQQKMPVYEMQVAKSKFGSFKGRLFFEFFPQMSYFREVPEAQVQRYNQMVSG